MRDVPLIWDTWRNGVYVGDKRPSTRVTVQKGWTLQATEPVLGTWSKGPARWYQAKDNQQWETEVPNVISFSSDRSVDGDAGSCEIIIRNHVTPTYGDAERTPGQFGEHGYFTWDHGVAQETKARWRHLDNPWREVLVPNALLRTYQGFGGYGKPIRQAQADGDLVLNGVWLIDDVEVSAEGTLTLKCRDMGKLLVDQQLFPPLVPTDKYPLDYRRWIYKVIEIPGDPSPERGDMCFPCEYAGSSTDETYGAFNAGNTGHPGGDAFDISFESGDPNSISTYSHQRTYWLSEPKGSANDTAWIEFTVAGGNAGDINQIYYHAWKGVIEGRGVHRVMVSVYEHDQWVPGETSLGGVTPEGLPYVTTFTPGTELNVATSTNLYPLPRDYRATRIRLTVTSLLLADDFAYGYGDPDYHGGGYRAGARKIMACFSATVGETRMPILTFAAASIPKNTDNRMGYWQVRANGQVFAFGDARVYGVTSPANTPISTVIGMAAHPDGVGYWYVDVAGRVVSAGSAYHYGDLSDSLRADVTDIAPAPDGNGYWLLTLSGEVHAYGSATHQGDSPPSGTMPSGSPVLARSIDSHPTTNGYWVLHTNGTVTAHNVAHYGNATDRTGFTPAEYVASIHRTSTGLGYWVLSGSGKVQAKGDAPHKGNAELKGYDGDRWYKGICWDLIPSSVDDQGYAIQSADGNLWIKGNAKGLNYGSIGAGKATQRFDGNYKDYSDIIKDLVLWGGFYLYVNPQPIAEFPGIYGNVETTGAWAEDPLPKSMFDKRPIIEAINDIKKIVGYVVYIDAEGGFRFESPNWWTIGNYLMDGTPYMHMPEVDEKNQLLQHTVTRSAKDARSRLIISTADPYPSIPGQEAPKEVVTTEIVPSTAADLHGLIVPAMWANANFLRKDEQKVMADLIDMRIWFGRRMAQVSCVNNPLIDLNDQVRIIERQSGEVYIHYIRSINVSHDLLTGDFRMSLTTYWLGGSPWGRKTQFFAAANRPQGDGYWLVTRGGADAKAKAGVYTFGAAQLYERHEDDSHLEEIISIRSTPSGNGYYTVDESGKVLTYGDAVHYGDLNRGPKDPHEFRRSGDVTDMALSPSGHGYWLLQKDGTVNGFGDAVFYGNANPTGNLLPDIEVFAHSIESHPVTAGYWVLTTDGKVEAFNLPDYGDATRAGLDPADYAARLRRTPDGGGYIIVHPYGSIQARGNATLFEPDAPPAAEVWPYSLFWGVLINPDGGYGIVRGDGTVIPHHFTARANLDPAPVEAFWALVSPDVTGSVANSDHSFAVSKEVMAFLANTASPSANNAVVNNFAAPTEALIRGES